MDGETDERVLYLGLGLVAVALLALIWATGALAGATFGSGSGAVRPAETVAVALRLPSHLGDPRTAWPPPARGRLPGAVGVYVCAAFLLGLAAGLVTVAVRALSGIELLSIWQGRGRPPAASWATGRDLAPLAVSGPERGRLTLGRRGKVLLAAEERQSVIVFGPTQTHKTSGLVVPALLEWQGPVLCTSVKTDLIDPTFDRREDLGKVWIFDPAQQTGYEGARATPLREAADWPGALRVAHWLAGSAKTAAGDLSDADFWFANAEKLIAPLLLAAVNVKGTMATVVAWLDEGPEKCGDQVGPILDEARQTEARRAFEATQNREERQRSSVYTTAETILAAFADPRVAAETSASDYTPELLLDGRNTLYLVAPRTEQERLRTVFSTLIVELIAEVEARSAATARPIDPPLLLLLDECANIAPFPGLDEVASTAAGLGIQLVSVFQDVAQMQARLGRRAPTTFNNHRAKLATPGISDLETTEYFTRLIGAGEFEQRSVSTQRGERAHRSQTEGDTYRELAPAHVLRQSAEASALMVYGSLPPTTIALRPFFEEPGLIEIADRADGVP